MISTLPCTREYQTQPTASVRCCFRYRTRSWCPSRYCCNCTLSMASASRVWPDSSSALRRSSLSRETSRSMLMSERSMARVRDRNARSSICTSSQRRISVAASRPFNPSISASISSPWSISSRPRRSSLCTRRVCDFFSSEKICRILSSEKPSIFWVMVVMCLCARDVPSCPNPPQGPGRRAGGGTRRRCSGGERAPPYWEIVRKKKRKSKRKISGRAAGRRSGPGTRQRPAGPLPLRREGSLSAA